MSKGKQQVLDFSLSGQLSGFVIKDGYKIKYLKIIVAQREYWVKLPKEIRENFNPEIIPGNWLDITGIRKQSKTGKVKLEATEVSLADSFSGDLSLPQKQINREKEREKNLPGKGISRKSKVTQASILVCRKSSCQKKGSKAICRAIEANLENCGLQEEVKVKFTGCLKQCKKGPNLVIMPDKKRYSQVKPQQIPELLAKHL